MAHDGGVIEWRAVCEAAAPLLDDGIGYEIPNPLRQRLWAEPGSEVSWRRRGDVPMPVRRARQLMGAAGTLVLHVYDGEPHLHEGEDRTALLAEVRRVLAGTDPDPMHTFELGEFRDERGRVMVIIVERC